jgi:hypothetical protein
MWSSFSISPRSGSLAAAEGAADAAALGAAEAAAVAAAVGGAFVAGAAGLAGSLEPPLQACSSAATEVAEAPAASSLRMKSRRSTRPSRNARNSRSASLRFKVPPGDANGAEPVQSAFSGFSRPARSATKMKMVVAMSTMVLIALTEGSMFLRTIV